ncbi:hypothetical protein K440DRAFT_619340, partial [Wilcoxina mikolae CBS 423.85]
MGFGGLEVPGWTVPAAVILGSLVPLLFVQYLRLAYPYCRVSLRVGVSLINGL